MLTEEVNRVKSANENMTKTLEDSQNHNKVQEALHSVTCSLNNWMWNMLYNIICCLLWIDPVCDFGGEGEWAWHREEKRSEER